MQVIEGCRKQVTITLKPSIAFESGMIGHFWSIVCTCKPSWTLPWLRLEAAKVTSPTWYREPTPARWALKVMDYDPSGPFITSILELKLNEDILFKWQRHSHKSGKNMLNFLDLRHNPPRALSTKWNAKVTPHNIWSHMLWVWTTLVRHVKGENIPYTHAKNSSCCPMTTKCPSQRAMDIFICLKKGHMSKQCPSSLRCQKCTMPHHTWLQKQRESEAYKLAKEPAKSVVSHTHRGWLVLNSRYC